MGAHVTVEARVSIEKAQKLFYLVSDFTTEQWLQSLNPTAESLRSCYVPGRQRSEIYEEMVERTLGPVRRGLHVCMALYGHPAVCANSSREAVKRARHEGFDAVMQPGISAEDCLFADLNIDPSHGCQSFDATNFVMRRRKADPSIGLILLQVAQIGVSVYRARDCRSPKGLQLLTEFLLDTYPAKHKVTIYQTNCLPLDEPIIETVWSRNLLSAPVTVRSLLYVPPLYSAPIDQEIKTRLVYD